MNAILMLKEMNDLSKMLLLNNRIHKKKICFKNIKDE